MVRYVTETVFGGIGNDLSPLYETDISKQTGGNDTLLTLQKLIQKINYFTCLASGSRSIAHALVVLDTCASLDGLAKCMGHHSCIMGF